MWDLCCFLSIHSFSQNTEVALVLKLTTTHNSHNSYQAMQSSCASAIGLPQPPRFRRARKSGCTTSRSKHRWSPGLPHRTMCRTPGPAPCANTTSPRDGPVDPDPSRDGPEGWVFWDIGAGNSMSKSYESHLEFTTWPLACRFFSDLFCTIEPQEAYGIHLQQFFTQKGVGRLLLMCCNMLQRKQSALRTSFCG